MGHVWRGGVPSGCANGECWVPRLVYIAALLLLVPAGQAASLSHEYHTTSNHDISVNEIEAFVKKLQYEAVNGVDNRVDGEAVSVNLNLLPDDVIAEDILDGLQEEFSSVGEMTLFMYVYKELSDNSTKSVNSTTNGPQSRQLSLIFQGVYAPDARFNAFVDGVMINMVAEMKRKRMDPLYFRVYDRGIIEHVTTSEVRGSRQDESTTVSSVNSASKNGRQRGSAIGGGVIRGLTNVKRFGNAEVQIAGNLTLVRSHYVYGPLNIELVFQTDKGVKTINSTLTAVAAHAVTEVNDNSSKLIDFIIDSPLFDYMPYYGNRTLAQQQTAELVVRHLFSNASFMATLLRDAYELASYDKIIPQFGTESNYYSVLKYLFKGTPSASGRSQPLDQEASIVGVPSAIATYLADTVHSAPVILRNLG
ncbi:uncharacterized protein [Cherax quadricarinatus]|uniref:uncharacterized protein isoform X3 n=1 Tax=Cherax quadricarinatus TaxID=27406 RepID=UPI0023783ED8|nr:uncharacterized protein LOC128687572 isoform X3 [Cherax quadricarinatus]